MKTVLNIKTDVDVKKQAQEIARQIGLPLSTVVNAYLKEFIQKKRLLSLLNHKFAQKWRKGCYKLAEITRKVKISLVHLIVLKRWIYILIPNAGYDYSTS